jgi:NAD(P)-dependent dehydrogenase (short-subunit alcohol dehydrogenase family)
MKDLLDFREKHILISGAAEGIGRETAVLLSTLGARLTLIDRNMDELAGTSSQLEGIGHHLCLFDLKELDGIKQMISDTVKQQGPVDGVVHCVGIRSRRPLIMITPEVLNEVMSVNFGSFMEIVRSVSAAKHFNKGLSIVGISSVSSLKGGISVTAYAASKAAMDSAVRCLAKELAPRGIRLNTIAPAQIDTPEYRNMVKNASIGEEKILERQYLGLGKPRDVANAVIFLLSNMSRFITGTIIPVDGGYLSS